MLYDTVRPALGGRDGEMIFSARLDNLAMCHAGVRARSTPPRRRRRRRRPRRCALRPRGGGQRDRVRGPVRVPPARARAHRQRPRRLTRGLPPRPRRLALRVGGHGPRGPPQLRGPPRSAPQAGAQRRTGDQDQRAAALRHERAQRPSVPSTLCAGRGSRSSTTLTAPICPAAAPSGRSLRRSSGSAPSTSATRCSACTRSGSSAARKIPQ